VLRTGEENGWESSGWELDVDFLFLAVKLMICSLLRTGEENGWESSGWELDVDFLFLALFLQLYTSDTTRHKREDESKSMHLLTVGRHHRIHMFLGLPDPDPLVRGVDPDPDPSVILLSKSKNSKKKLDSYSFVTSFGLFIFEK
jgi:hypothetical protein